MILVKYSKTDYNGHDCWGKPERTTEVSFREFESVEDWLEFKKTTKLITFIKMYIVKEVVE